MTFDDRVSYVLLGIVIGFFMGNATRILSEIKEGVHEVLKILKTRPPRKRDERGVLVINKTFLNNLALALIILVTVVSAFKAQKASNEVGETQKRLDSVVSCNKQVLSDALDALNTRSTFSRSQASSNLALQKDQATLFKILLHIPPYTKAIRLRATQDYNESLGTFIKAGTKAEKNALVTKYPDAEDLVNCIVESKEK